MPRFPRLLPLCGALLLLGACTTERRLVKLDGSVARLLGAATAPALGEGATPEALSIDGYRPWRPPEEGLPEGVLSLDLQGALELAAKHSRSYQNARENLYQSALSLVGQQHLWEWNPIHNLSLLFRTRQSPESESAFSTEESLGFSKRLAAGGRLTGSLALSTLRYCSGDRSVNIGSLASLTLTQPLLAGAGKRVAREPLTQAERNLVYALRNYVRARKALLLDIAEKYYNVLNAEADLQIGQMTYESLKYSQDRSLAMSEGGRVTQIDVDQARQRLLTAESNLVSYRESIQNAKDALKVALAIPLETEIALSQKDLTVLLSASLPEPDCTLEEAVAQALRDRLDLANARDALEDARRAVEIARDDMRAKLDLTLSATARGTQGNRIHAPRLGKAEFSAALDADLPLDRTTQAIALRRAMIDLGRQERELEQAREEITQSLRRTWNTLLSYRQRIAIQKLSVSLAEKRVENTRMLFEDGRIAIREYLDAQDDLSNARNSLTRQLVSNRICWLQLLHQREELPVDPGTLWCEQMEMP